MEPLEDTHGIYLIIGVKHTFQTCIYFSRCLLYYALAGKEGPPSSLSQSELKPKYCM